MDFTIRDIAGWNSKLHKGLKEWAIIKFGVNPNKRPNDHTSWEPTTDKLANRLLDRLVGASYYNTAIESIRVFNRALWIQELVKYLSTNECNMNLIDKLAKEDKYWHCNGMHYQGDTKRLLLTA